jgi:hypothetical protein
VGTRAIRDLIEDLESNGLVESWIGSQEEVVPDPRATKSLFESAYNRMHMSKSIRLSEEAYERLAAHKREDETFSESSSSWTESAR